MANIAQFWIGNNNRIIALTQRVRWEITGLEGLSTQQWYLVCSNHLSGLDIPVLQKVFHRRIPFLRFFLKQNLIWMPVLGQAWWALDFPFMKRHSAEVLARNPEKRLDDLASARRACEKLKHLPASVLSFAEGTRFTPEKHAEQKSPYTHLLRPKAGGLAYAMAALGSRFHSMLDVTLHYPDGDVTMTDMAMGRVHRIVVHVRQLAIPNEFIEGDYVGDAEFRERFKLWLNEIWEEKDALIEQMIQADLALAAAPAAVPQA
jgi:1-acyl-sn-glycerol-3-phosphate acyltransferase